MHVRNVIHILTKINSERCPYLQTINQRHGGNDVSYAKKYLLTLASKQKNYSYLGKNLDDLLNSFRYQYVHILGCVWC